MIIVIAIVGGIGWVLFFSLLGLNLYYQIQLEKWQKEERRRFRYMIRPRFEDEDLEARTGR